MILKTVILGAIIIFGINIDIFSFMFILLAISLLKMQERRISIFKYLEKLIIILVTLFYGIEQLFLGTDDTRNSLRTYFYFFSIFACIIISAKTWQRSAYNGLIILLVTIGSNILGH